MRKPEATNPDPARTQARSLMLDSALELFTSKGFPHVTLDDIAIKAETTETIVQSEFETPFAILEALYDHIASECTRAILDGVDRAPNNFLEQLHAGVSAYVHTMLDDPRRALLVGIESSGVNAAFDAKKRRERRIFASVIAQLAVTYEDRQIINVRFPELSYVGLVTALFEIVTEYALMPDTDRPPLEDVIDEIARFTKGVVVTPRL